MILQTSEQQKIFDNETQSLESSVYNVSGSFIESLGFQLVRIHTLTNLKGDEAELEVYEDGKGGRIVKLCVTQVTHSEGELYHISCFADTTLMPILEKEYNRYR